jgi:hypothetical protein
MNAPPQSIYVSTQKFFGFLPSEASTTTTTNNNDNDNMTYVICPRGFFSPPPPPSNIQSPSFKRSLRRQFQLHKSQRTCFTQLNSTLIDATCDNGWMGNEKWEDEEKEEWSCLAMQMFSFYFLLLAGFQECLLLYLDSRFYGRGRRNHTSNNKQNV